MYSIEIHVDLICIFVSIFVNRTAWSNDHWRREKIFGDVLFIFRL